MGAQRPPFNALHFVLAKVDVKTSAIEMLKMLKSPLKTTHQIQMDLLETSDPSIGHKFMKL